MAHMVFSNTACPPGKGESGATVAAYNLILGILQAKCRLDSCESNNECRGKGHGRLEDTQRLNDAGEYTIPVHLGLRWYPKYCQLWHVKKCS